MKYLNQLLALVLTAIFMGNSIAQTIKTIPADSVSVGLPGSSQNPTIKLDTGYIRKNKTSGKMEFSHDGTLAKVFGTGSGSGDGGAPINDNPSFEDGVSTGYTYSGSSFTSGTYTNGIEGDLKFATFTASAAGQYFETTLKPIPDFSNGGCLAKIDYNTTSLAGVWKLQVYDSSSNLLVDKALDPASWRPGYASFPCPTIGTQVKARVISTAAGTIQADRIYLGKENRTFQTMTVKTGAVTTLATTLCSWSNNGTTALTSIVDNDCPVPTATGIASAPATRVPGIVLPAGTGPVIDFGINGYFRGDRSSNTNAGCAYDLWDGANSYPLNWIVVGGASGNQAIAGTRLGARVVLNSPLSAATTYQVRVYANSATTLCSIENDDPSTMSFQIAATAYPSDSQTAITSEQSGWFVDANIGGANPTVPSVSSSYVGIENASLDMVLKSGSSDAQIGCSGTNSPTGLTCASGNESVSVAWTPPYSGWFDVCFDFTSLIATNAASSASATWEVIETDINTQNILSEGGSRFYTGNSNASTGMASPVHVCGSFYASGVSKKMHRVMYESTLIGTTSSNIILADRDSSSGQRDIRVTVRPSTMNVSRPVLTGDQMTSRGAVNPDIQSVFFGSSADCSTVCSTGTCTICNRVGTKITSVTWQSLGGYYANGIDGTKYNCSGAGLGSNYSPIMHFRVSSTSSYAAVQAASGATGVNVGHATLTCVGQP